VIGESAVRPHRLAYAVPRGAGPGEPPPVPEVLSGQEGVPPDVLEGMAPLITAAAAFTPDGPGCSGVLGHTRLPGGASVLHQADAPPKTAGDGGSVPVARVNACYLPDGAEALGDRTPVETWRSALWEDQWEEGQSLGDGCPRWCDDERLVEFAAERGEQVEWFLADVQRLFLRPAGRQILIAERDLAVVARWIALACASLPLSHARLLTFALRTDVPSAAPQQILGIGPDCEADRFDETLLRHLYRVHDGLGGPGSPPRPGPGPWAQIAAQAWRQGIPPRAARGLSGPFDIVPLQDALLPTGIPLPGTANWASMPGNEDVLSESGRRLVEPSAGPGDEHARRETERVDEQAPPGAAGLPPGAPTASNTPTASSAPTAAVDALPGGAMDRLPPVRQPAGPPHGLRPPEHTDVPEAVEARPRPPLGASYRRLSPGELEALLRWLGTSVPACDNGRLAVVLGGLAPGSTRSDGAPDPTARPEDVRAQAIERLRNAIRTCWTENPEDWASLLEVLHALRPPVPDRVSGHETEVAAKLARDLFQPDKRDRPGTLSMLERLPGPFVERLLAELNRFETGAEPPRAVREVIASSLADWFASVRELAPMRLRLLIHARELDERRVAGLGAFRELAGLLSFGPRYETGMFRLAWRFAWPDAGPTVDEAAAVAHEYGAHAFARAELGQELAAPLTAHSPVTAALGDLAESLLAQDFALSTQRRRVAEVLRLAWRLEHDRVRPAEAADRIRELTSGHHVRDAIRVWFNERLAVRLATGHPWELHDRRVLTRLQSFMEEDLLDAYVTEQLAPKHLAGLVSRLAAEPDHAARLFAAWDEKGGSCSSGWPKAAARLTHEVFGELVRRLRPEDRQRIADRLGTTGGSELTQTWWRFADRFPPP
jgi:GTPase-associated protein 1, C-terminal domain/GTPase-associated protein 1, middle domain